MKDLIKVLQRQLNRQFKSGIKVDGILGAATVSALDKTGKSVLELIEPQVSTILLSIADIRDKTKLKVVPENHGQWYTYEDLLPFIKEAADDYTVPVSTLKLFLLNEADKRHSQGRLQFNANSISRTRRHFGLMQMYSGAWLDAQAYDVKVGVNKLKTFKHKFDPRQNILAAAAYIRANRIFAMAYDHYDGPFTPEIDYAMYNQGHTFVKKAKRGDKTVVGSQSNEASNLFTMAREQIRTFAMV